MVAIPKTAAGFLGPTVVVLCKGGLGFRVLSKRGFRYPGRKYFRSYRPFSVAGCDCLGYLRVYGA